MAAAYQLRQDKIKKGMIIKLIGINYVFNSSAKVISKIKQFGHSVVKLKSTETDREYEVKDTVFCTIVPKK